MKQIFARVTAYTSSLWQVAPWTLVIYLIAGGLIWGINNWDAR